MHARVQAVPKARSRATPMVQVSTSASAKRVVSAALPALAGLTVVRVAAVVACQELQVPRAAPPRLARVALVA